MKLTSSQNTSSTFKNQFYIYISEKNNLKVKFENNSIYNSTLTHEILGKSLTKYVQTSKPKTTI